MAGFEGDRPGRDINYRTTSFQIVRSEGKAPVIEPFPATPTVNRYRRPVELMDLFKELHRRLGIEDLGDK